MKPSLEKSREQAQTSRMRGVATTSGVTSHLLQKSHLGQVLHILPLWTTVRLLQVSNNESSQVFPSQRGLAA